MAEQAIQSKMDQIASGGYILPRGISAKCDYGNVTDISVKIYGTLGSLKSCNIKTITNSPFELSIIGKKTSVSWGYDGVELPDSLNNLAEYKNYVTHVGGGGDFFSGIIYNYDFSLRNDGLYDNTIEIVSETFMIQEQNITTANAPVGADTPSISLSEIAENVDIIVEQLYEDKKLDSKHFEFLSHVVREDGEGDVLLDETYISWHVVEFLINGVMGNLSKECREDLNIYGGIRAETRISKDNYDKIQGSLGLSELQIRESNENGEDYVYIPAVLTNSHEDDSWLNILSINPYRVMFKKEFNDVVKLIDWIYINTKVFKDAFSGTTKLKDGINKILDEINVASSNIFNLHIRPGESNWSFLNVVDGEQKSREERHEKTANQMVDGEFDGTAYHMPAWTPNSLVKSISITGKIPDEMKTLIAFGGSNDVLDMELMFGAMKHPEVIERISFTGDEIDGGNAKKRKECIEKMKESTNIFFSEAPEIIEEKKKEAEVEAEAASDDKPWYVSFLDFFTGGDDEEKMTQEHKEQLKYAYFQRWATDFVGGWYGGLLTYSPSVFEDNSFNLTKQSKNMFSLYMKAGITDTGFITNDDLKKAGFIQRVEPVIPIELSATIEGISGLQYGDYITVGNNIYGGSHLYVIVGLDHTVGESGWETTIKAYMKLSSIQSKLQ